MGRTFGGLVLLTVGFLATLDTFLGFFGSVWWAFDVMANFRFQYAVALLITGILYGLILGRVTSLVFLVAGLINVIIVLPLFLDSPAPRHSDAAINVASLNVQATTRSRDRIVDWVEGSEADIVFLLETSEPWVDEIRSDVPGYQIVEEIPEDRVYGITVLARSGMVDKTEVFRAGDIKDVVLRVETRLNDEDIVVYALHPRSPTNQPDAEARDEVIEFVARRARDETVPVVVVGDLNATPWSHAFRNLTSTADLVDSTRGFGFQPSWPGGMWFGFKIPIDHLLHSPELTTVERGIGPDLGSDHRPLMVTLAMAR
jgi:endonuclease/exonuclease/phosphatase (EEP) superfamily protein YafD